MKKLIGSIFIVLVSLVMRAQPFYFGADLSYVKQMEDCGAIYKEDGELKDVFSIFADHGTNLARFRLWHTPSWQDDLGFVLHYNDFLDVELAMLRAENAGMDVLLDFHLSDVWADPGHQVVPAAWAPVVNDLEVLKDSLYNYIYSTLFNLHTFGLLPEIVQIGNETNKGILLSQEVNDMGWSLDWNRNAALFNEAIKAIRDVEGATGDSVKIALHIADPSEVNWYIGQFWSHNVRDFDIIGISYYHTWHDDLISAVGNTITSLRNEYPEQEVMIFETAYPWTSSYEDNANNLLSEVYPGYPFSPANQKQWMIDLAQEVIDHGGSGVIYWEPGWVSTVCKTLYGTGSNWENATFFDFDDNLMEPGGIEWMEHAYNFPTSIEIISTGDPNFIIYQNGKEIWIRPIEGRDGMNGKIYAELIGLNGISYIKNEIEVQSNKDQKLLLVDNLMSGIYFIKLIHDGNVVVRKIFIKN